MEVQGNWEGLLFPVIAGLTWTNDSLKYGKDYEKYY